MSSVSILLLVTLLGLLSVTQSRPRERTHQGLYDDLKPVPFVDNPEEYGYMYGVYSEKQGKKDKAKSNLGQVDRLHEYYDRYNKENNRDIAGEDVKGNESGVDIKKSRADTIVTDDEPDLTQLPVEGGVEDKRTKSKHTKAKSNSKPKNKEKEISVMKYDEPKKPKVVKDKKIKNPNEKKERINHRHSKHGKKRKSEKKSKNKSSKKLQKEQPPTTVNPNFDESFLGSVDQEPGHFNMKDFIKEHPDFKENVGTILAKSDEKVTSTPLATTTTGVKTVKTTPSDESDDDDGDDDDFHDDDIDDDSDDDDFIGPDSESNDKSSEEYEFYDYYDEDGDSSYSSSEIAAEQGLYGTPYDWFKQYERMFGDQPVADRSEHEDNKVENSSDETKYETKSVKTEPVTKPVEKTTTAIVQENIDKFDQSDNIPKTAIEPSTSPNPPTPQKDVRSTVTQPAIPQWKQKLNSWNYIESRPVEACRSDMDCTAGRMCKFGLCLCGQPDFCDGHSKPVCGSDGQQYPSHCELHRTACILGFHIRIDHENNCFKDKQQGNEVVNSYQIDDIKDKTKDAKTAEIPDPVLSHTIPKTVVKKGGKSGESLNEEAESQDKDQTNKDSDNEVSDTKPVDKVNDVLDLSEVSKDVVIGGGMVEKAYDNFKNQDVNNEADSLDSENNDYDNSLNDDDDDDLDDDSVEELYHGDVITTPLTPQSDYSAESDETDKALVNDKISFGEGSIQKVDDSESSEEQDSLIPLFCTPDVYMKFKADILEYHCIYFGLQNCDKQTQEEKQKLAAMMFNYFDDNYNGTIEKEELWEMQLRERIDEISSLCTLLDIATFDELGERDGKLSTDEFIQAFDIPDLLEHKLEIVPLLTTVGNGLEVKCDVTTSEDVVWKRNDVDLSLLDFPGISVLSDGSLYIESIGVDHVSNLTCYDRKKPSVKQMHMLTIQKPPHVIVSPETLDTVEGKNVLLHCHAEGYPVSTIEWQFEDKTIQQGAKYYIRDYDNSLTVMHVEYMTDTGSYKCIARNNAGIGEASIHMTVHHNNETQYDTGIPPAEESFVVFHDDGYTMHEPSLCLTQRHVVPSFGNFYYIPDELDAPPALCESGVPCVWGSAINVKNTFIYATQPRENRIVVIDIKGSFNPNQVIFTDHIPVSLHYIDHLDEVWVVCWNGENDNGSKTIVIIRNASQKMQHHAIHTQPIGNRFDLVQDLFLPPDSELHHPFKFGYTVHNEQQGLFKIELVTKKYLKAVDLTKYACVPHSVAFEPLGGNVLVQCIQNSASGETNLILNLDYITDTVKQNFTMPGVPFVSPDSNNVVIVDQEGGRISIFKVTDQGLIERQFEVSVDIGVDSATFRKAQYGPGYDLYLVSADTPAIFSVSLTSGKMDTINDVGESDPALYLPWAKKTRPLISGDVFSDYLTTASESSMIILDGHHHRINCNFNHLHNPTVLAYSRIKK